uniref:PI-PLC Y-box domain-containing protein n=1 Tax=viral metagenome TaxID=1070528 RepID=A0A6C0H5K9_9ZZZZ
MDDAIINILFAVLCFIFILYYIIYFIYLSSMKKRECNNNNSLYSSLNGSLRSIQSSDDDCKHTLKDYYIKGAYNCCNGGNYKNDFVDLCILKNILKQGVRALDFEIFSIDNLPVVSSSTSSSNFFIKETYNQIPFSEVLKTLQNYAFTNSTCPNPTDPLFLHFRFKTSNLKMYQNFASILKQYDSILLGNKYSFEYYGENLGNVPLLDLCNKIIIIVDKSNTSFLECQEFYEYVNITSNSIFMRDLHYNQIQYNPDINELTEFNKKYMTFAMPNSGSSPDNPNSIVIRQTGCQFIAMRYTVFDTNLEENEMFFDEKGYAFVLKPESLRFIPVVVNDPDPQNPELSYANRQISSNYYNFVI